MADQLSKKRNRDSVDIEEKQSKLLKHAHEPNDDDDDDDDGGGGGEDGCGVDEDDEDEDEINLDESDEDSSLNIANDLTSQLMAINSSLLLNKNLLLSNMAQSLIMQSNLLVMAHFGSPVIFPLQLIPIFN